MSHFSQDGTQTQSREEMKGDQRQGHPTEIELPLPPSDGSFLLQDLVHHVGGKHPREDFEYRFLTPLAFQIHFAYFIRHEGVLSLLFRRASEVLRSPSVFLFFFLFFSR